jgi:integrase
MARAQRLKYMKFRNGSWVYHREWPKDVGEIDGTKAFVRSFKTSDCNAASRQWSTFDAEYEAKTKQERSFAIFRTSKDARREKFWLSVARWIAYEKARSGGQLQMHPNMGIPTMVHHTSHTFAILRKMFRDWAEQHDPDAAAVFVMSDIRLDQLFELGLIGSYFVALEGQKIESGKKSVVPSGTGTTLVEVLDKFKAEKKRSQATYDDMRRAIDTLAAACGGEAPTVEATTKEHMQKFRAFLVKRDDWKGRTRNKIRANLSSLYSHAQALFLIEHNLVELVATFDQSDSEERKPFSDADLKAIFHRDRYGIHIGAVRFWIPLISLFTAARQGELGQLDRRDVFQEPDSGLWVMSISDDGEGQSAKTDRAVRVIPIPQTLIDLGFIEFVLSVRSGPLFGLKRSPSGAFPNLSHEMNEMIRTAGISDPLKVFHSYRHTTRTKARTFEIPEEAMDFITGHKSVKNVGRRYGTHELPLLKRLVDRIRYPLNLPVWKLTVKHAA